MRRMLTSVRDRENIIARPDRDETCSTARSRPALFHVKQSMRTLPQVSDGLRGADRPPECRARPGHAVQATRLPHRTRSRRFEFGTGFVGQPGYRGIVHVGEDQTLVAAERIDIGGLALEIDIIFGVDLDMGRDRRSMADNSGQMPRISAQPTSG